MREVVVVDFKGRITIPKYLREEVGIREGDKVIIEIGRDGRSLIIRSVVERGSLIMISVEKREDIDTLFEEFKRFLPEKNIIDLRCVRDVDNKYSCKIIAEIDLRDEKMKKIIEELSQIYHIEKL
ncbi:MAG: AbrB/MazE/SpoVT family DNA-binding domain-containing protein [Desulfurococcaceae archaeon]|nr:AbrB/MazE/SpoVT family DNA-binding domain-containing protein [Desulfurococcaceae archaeon]